MPSPLNPTHILSHHFRLENLNPKDILYTYQKKSSKIPQSIFQVFIAESKINGQLFGHRPIVVKDASLRVMQLILDSFLPTFVRFILHMGAEPQNSFKGVARGPLYGKMTRRHQRLSYQINHIRFLEIFDQKVD